MSKADRRAFYKDMEMKLGTGEEFYSPRAIAGTIIKPLGMERCRQFLDIAQTFEDWLILCQKQMEYDGFNTSAELNALTRIRDGRELIETLLTKYEIKKDGRKRRSEAAGMIKQIGVKSCATVLNEEASYSDWHSKCQLLVIRKSEAKRARKRRRSKTASREPAMIKRTTYKKSAKNPVARAQQKFLEQIEWQFD
ncbi:MAG: hypothetical protein F4X87_08720 [Chloroflexi bacterium]|nr:hypothetical protein [Chloroflexota bacterium]